MTIQFSRRLAIVFGILAPLGETVRRWSTWREWPPNFFDDYIMGAFLLYGAWRVGRDVRGGQRFLAAAWAFTCGIGYYSFFGHLKSLSLHEVDPAPIPSEWVAVIKGVGLALSLLALVISLRRQSESQY
ncbi:MAG: hypothetical protein QOD32_2388 [Pyrinomonadaceae bacterium]|jgi:hypothetical protein|nr:hypothetical protein [Pyrinomonadaceae bacterium]